MTATCNVTVQSSGAYFLHDSQDDFDLLLATTDIVSYTDSDTSKTVYAYNGFIKETQYASWYRATSFVKALNDNNIKPTDAGQGTNGSWRLLKSNADAIAWANASTGEESGFERAVYLWTSLESDANNSYFYGCNNYYWRTNTKTCCRDIEGFIVIWEPAN